jgi:hypothetical protein
LSSTLDDRIYHHKIRNFHRGKKPWVEMVEKPHGVLECGVASSELVGRRLASCPRCYLRVALLPSAFCSKHTNPYGQLGP